MNQRYKQYSVTGPDSSLSCVGRKGAGWTAGSLLVAGSSTNFTLGALTSPGPSTQLSGREEHLHPRHWGSSTVDGFLSKGLYYDKVSWPWDRVALSQHLFFLLV